MRISPSFLPLVAVAATAASASVISRPAQPAEELHTDAAGNLVWQNTDDARSASAALGRPSFNGMQQSEMVQAWRAFENDFMDGVNELEATLKEAIQAASKQAGSVAHDAHKTVNGWAKTAKVWVDGVEYDKFVHTSFPDYSLRVTASSNGTLCDSSVKQHSGYLDISDTKHLWFVMFESRNNPAKDPVQLWLNGGPGCSSSTGLLFELGPCSIADGGERVVNNPNSWNNNANLLFLDQPVNVGYSYSDDGDNVNNSPVAAEDVYAFLQLFFQRFDQYSKLPFHISGESYAGTYIPNIGNVVHNKNKELRGREGVSTLGTGPVHINLESLFIGNGLSAPLEQFGSTPEYACSPDNPYQLFKNDSSTCSSLRQKAKSCTSLIETCYKYNSRLTCLPAALYCWSNLYGPLQQTNKNLYDLRRDCDREKDGQLCYREMEWMEVFMNKPEVKKAFGASSDVQFQSCNMQINQGFLLQGDSMHDSSALLPPLIEDGIRVGIYAGVADAMCHWVGNEKWTSKLDHSFSKEYKSASTKQWKEGGKSAGTVRSAGEGFGNFAFITINEAGHMVPFDQPQWASKLQESWINNKALV
ncbi:unnamed protein product [Jaminaea pallidilutea]